ncbi:MAG: Fic family protein [Spirochaetes bacterium]|nr:Fic family protein [Spirochaetota bacterium]
MEKSLFDIFNKLDLLKEKLAGLRPLNPGELNRLREEFMIQNTYDTNAIEGNTLTLRETVLILKEDITIAEKPLRMHLEAIGHRDAFKYMLTIANPSDPLTERRIKELHTLILMNDAENKGIYRNIGVTVLGATHTPPQAYLVEPQMEALIADYQAMKHSKHIVGAIAELHLRFEGIHPFIDGNGRTGRLIINLELIKAGLLPVNIKFTDRQKYYDCFDFYFNNECSPDALSELIANYEVQELERYIQIIETKNAGGAT